MHGRSPGDIPGAAEHARCLRSGAGGWAGGSTREAGVWSKQFKWVPGGGGQRQQRKGRSKEKGPGASKSIDHRRSSGADAQHVRVAMRREWRISWSGHSRVKPRMFCTRYQAQTR